jgi:hypothetical protein
VPPEQHTRDVHQKALMKAITQSPSFSTRSYATLFAVSSDENIAEFVRTVSFQLFLPNFNYPTCSYEDFSLCRNC